MEETAEKDGRREKERADCQREGGMNQCEDLLVGGREVSDEFKSLWLTLTLF